MLIYIRSEQNLVDIHCFSGEYTWLVSVRDVYGQSLSCCQPVKRLLHCSSFCLGLAQDPESSICDFIFSLIVETLIVLKLIMHQQIVKY